MEEVWVTYVVLEVPTVDIFGTALRLLGRRGQVCAGNARPVDDGADVGCLGALGRRRTLGDGGSKVDALPALDSLHNFSGDHLNWHLGWSVVCLGDVGR